MRILTAAALYFAIVFGAGFALGPLRALWLAPRLGETVAILCEVPVLLAAMILAARWIPKKVGLRTDPAPLVAMGVGALLFQQIADFLVGSALRGIAPVQQLAYLATAPGLIYLAALAAFAAMPALVNRRR
jgi:hypothetical protein